jgi:integrase
MQPRDLPHQREAQPRTIRVRAQPLERQEDTFALALRDALAGVHDAQHRPSIVWSHLDPNRRAAMPACILKQVTREAAQQARIPFDTHREALRHVSVACAFLRYERKQIDRLARGQRARGIEPACKQNLVNQKVELSDVAVEFGFVFRISCLLIQLDAEPETRRVTLRRLDLAAEISHLRQPQTIQLVISVNEAKRLLALAESLKVRVLLSLSYGCGLRAGEVVRLKVKHIDSAQNIIRIEQSKGRKDRKSHAISRAA